MTIAKCPTCKRPIEWGPQSPYRPFCSQRCRLMDLGGWLDGSNHIPGPELADEQLTYLQEDGRPANDDLDHS